MMPPLSEDGDDILEAAICKGSRSATAEVDDSAPKEACDDLHE